MWPRPGEGLDRVLAAEAAVEGLYREALTRWSPVALAAALPTFNAAVTADAGDPQDPQLPPDPAAVEQASGWGTVAETVIVAGVAVLFAAAVVEAMEGLGIPLPALGLPALAGKRQESAGKPQVAPPTSRVTVTRDQAKQSHRATPDRPATARTDPTPALLVPNPQDDATKPLVAPDLDPAVLQIVNEASKDLDAEQLHQAMRYVDETPALAQARDDIITQQREHAARTPAIVAQKVTAAIRDVEPTDGTVTLAAQRSAAAQVLDPDGDAMAQIAATAGHLSAAVQNHAVQAAAELSEDADDLEKVWICTLDGRTRDSHWAADGARVPLAAPFIVGGEPLMFPADPSGSPAQTYGCRCRMGILAKDEPLPTEVDRHTERLDGRDSVALHREGRTQVEEIEARAARGNTRARDNRDGQGTVASGGWTAPSDQEYDMTAPAVPADDTAAEAIDAGETYLTFTDALFAVTGTPTDDRRMLAADIELAFRDFPLPLQWKEKTGEGHNGSVTVGVIESARVEGGKVLGSGYMLNNANAFKALELIQHGVNRPSIDMADATAVPAYDDGTEVTEMNFDPSQRICETYTRATVTACTIVAIPAFGQTSLALNAERESRDVAMTAAALTAAAAYKPPVYEPAMFADADPNLRSPMRLTMDPDTGHVFGFIATWKDKHRSVGLGHIKPPRSHTNYEHFHTSPAVHLTDGTRLPVGRLTVGIGHAPTRGITSAAAQAHYDNVEACWALGRISEHPLGIYFSGVVAPWASPEKVQMGLSSPVSGDWRPVGQGNSLELVAVLSVNTPGFLCKVETDHSGQPLAMVASLSVADGAPAESWSLEDLRAVFAQVLAEERAAAARVDEALAVLDAAAAPARAAETAADADAEPDVDATVRMSALIAEFTGTPVDAPAAPAEEPAEPVELTPTDRMGALIGEFTGKVRDAAYWGKPVGTPITPGMKPKGKKKPNEGVERAVRQGHNPLEDSQGYKPKSTPKGDVPGDDSNIGHLSDKEQAEYKALGEKPNLTMDEEDRMAELEKKANAAAKKKGAARADQTANADRGADANEREAADLKDRIARLDTQIRENLKPGVNKDTTEIVKKKRELQARLDKLKGGNPGKA